MGVLDKAAEMGTRMQKKEADWTNSERQDQQMQSLIAKMEACPFEWRDMDFVVVRKQGSRRGVDWMVRNPRKAPLGQFLRT